MKAIKLLAAACVVWAVAGCDPSAPGSASTSHPGSVEANATVDYVVDGDTIDATVDGRRERVRLIGINTPEIAHAGVSTPAECFGDEATAFTRSLLPDGTPIRIERDVEPRDDYGRLLGYVYRASDGIFVNYELARQGYARPLTIGPNDSHAPQFVRAASAAHDADLGLWAACSDG